MPPPEKKKAPPTPKKAPPPATGKPKLTGKTYRVEEWSDDGEGLRIGLVADSGMGKTTLASMSPKPVFIGIDEGGRMIRNPLTGEKLKRIKGIEDYYDIKQVIRTPGIFDPFDTVVFDTVTMVETLITPWVLDNIKCEGGGTAKNIIAYGFNKGYRHIYDTFTEFLTDCDKLIHDGKNVILIGQNAAAKTANVAGDDYLCNNVRLQNQKENNIAQFNEWCDHVLRIEYIDRTVKDKKAKGSTDRAIFFKPEPHYFAKSRTLPLEEDCISFSSPDDNSIWEELF